MALAFRLYGDFHWPPTTALVEDCIPRRGLVEIHFIEKKGEPKGAPRHALLRWYPTTTEHEPKPPASAPDQQLFDLTPAEATKWFNDQKDECAIWLGKSKPLPASNDTWLVFRGAFLFEQYREPENDRTKDAVLDLQWPLVTRCEYVKHSAVYSVLGICHKAKPLLYFNFHLPFPVRRTSLGGANDINPTAFPFSAVVDLAPKAAGLLTIDTLVAGWTKDDKLPNIASSTRTSFPFKGTSNPKTRELGKFGFAENYTGSTAVEFATYNRPTAAETARYWPKNRKALLQDILWPYGFSVDRTNVEWLDFTRLELGDSSLRFPRSSKVPGSTTRFQSALIYRVSVRPTSEPTDKSGEFRSDSSGLRLRLKDEIGGRWVKGTQFGIKDTATAEAQSEVKGWLRTGEILSADCELSWEIARESIWTGNRDVDWAPTVTLHLHWEETIAKADDLAKDVTADTEFSAGLLRHAAYSFGNVREALEPGEAGQPHSFLPDLSTSKQTVRFVLHGSPLRAGFNAQPDAKSGRAISWGRADKPSPAWRRPPMRLTLAELTDLIPEADGKDVYDLKLRASGLTFFQTEDVGIALTLRADGNWAPQSSETVEDGLPFFASFAVDAGPEGNWEGRLASLQFSGTAAPQVAKKRGHLRIGGRGASLGYGSGAPILLYPDGRIAVELSLSIPTAKVEPISVDLMRGDRTGRPAPLLIPLLDRTTNGTKAAAAAAYQLWLTATETLSPTHDRYLKAEILEDAPDTGDRAYVVLSFEPFTIFRFSQQPLQDRGRADSASVAFYSGDERVWQYKRVTDFYHYVLPPQSVGESADKPRRLEIHDLPDRNTESPPRPFVLEVAKDKNGNLVLTPSEVRRRAVEFRLTPSAEIWIRPSDVERGYFMPEQTSYEIFRQFGAYGLGAALAYLRAEFLYGLPTGIDVSKERSIARGARVAEIEALTGRITGPALDQSAEPKLLNRWNALRTAVASRPERLEIWARDLDSVIDFTPARFTDGASFALRHTALHRPPMVEPGPEGKEDYSSLPRVGGLDPSKIQPGSTFAANPRHHPHGLSGGALWPAESLNLFRILLESPQSNGGSIESIALSPIGGDAAQKAEFLGGKVTIISETRNGYVQRQQVEVLGRICAFWHRAKHVVVYERTVNPTAQFAPKKKEDEQGTRSRRPILRKVREYIELLQPERNYPDFSIAAPRSTGFLERVRFNSKIINVDSAWASEVDKDGWQIPLWNRQSARERPQVYPMPDVAFVSTAEGDGDNPVVAQECLDPDYLFFFADLSPKTSSDTDTWVSRVTLDFPNMPAAKVISDQTDKGSSSDPGDEDGRAEKRRPPVGRILPGLRRFTWRLAPGAQKAAINAGRAGKPVYVGLDSVTFMRATHSAPTHKMLDEVLTKAIAAKSSISGKENPALTALGYWDGEGTNTAFDGAKAFSENMAALVKALNDQDLAALNAARNNVAQQWKGSFKTNLKGVIPDKLKDDLAGFTSDLKAAPALCGKLKTDAVEMIQRKEMLVRAAIQDWTAQADDFVTEGILFANGATKEQAITELKKLAVAYVRPLFAEASKDIGRIEEGVEKSKAALLDLEAEAEALVNRARQRLIQVANGYDDSKPWSPERRRALRAALKACVSSVEGDILAAIEETRQRLGVELNEVSQAIAGHIAKLIRVIAVTEADVIGQVESLHGAADRLYFRIDNILARIEASDAAGDIDALIAKVTNHASIPQDLKNKVTDALTALKGKYKTAKSNVADARTLAAALDALADESAATLNTEAKQLGTALKSAVTDLAQPAQDLVASIADLANVAADIAGAITNISFDLQSEVNAIATWSDKWLEAIGTPIDAVVAPATKFLDDLLKRILAKLREIPAATVPIIDDVTQTLQAAQKVLEPENLLEHFVADNIVGEALALVLKPVPDTITDVAAALLQIKQRLALLSEALGDQIRVLQASALDGLSDVTQACNALFEGVKEVEAYLNELAKPLNDVQTYFETQLNNAYTELVNRFGQPLEDVLSTFPTDKAANLIAATKSFDRSVRGLQNNLSRAYETANVYADRVFDQVGKIGEGGILAAPSNILKLYSAVTSAPEIAALKADIDRIRAGFDELGDIIDTTKSNALFNRLGDELKALGLSLPFDSIGERLLPADLTNFNIGRVFRNFGGTKLDNLLKGYKIPAGVRDAVRVTHDFDKKQARAWVQVDIDAPMPGRRSLFSVGVFKADFLDMHLTGQVRLEASKDQDKVTSTGYGRIGAAIDLVVSGQSMVRFEKFGLNLTREKGLKVEFDPKNIRLNPSFKFIQDFLSTLFPDKIGGLDVIKQNGIPVGVQHTFSIPPISLNFATSGISNISIENRFKLLAFPDFMLANRFNLSTVERPFIFSIFIIGGTGYIQIDAEFRPFDSELMVSVEAGAGGSASLAFAFGPFSGQVFITLSGALTYRKVIGKPGGGLSVSAILVIAGHVDVAGIVTVGIVLMLRMTYRDNGQIDADGSLTVTIRISKFFKITARANAKYKMRGGKSETVVSTSTDVEADPSIKKKVDQLKSVADKLEQARN